MRIVEFEPQRLDGVVLNREEHREFFAPLLANPLMRSASKRAARHGPRYMAISCWPAAA